MYSYIFIQQCGTPANIPAEGNSQPHIVVIRDEDDEVYQYFIAVEQQLLFECSNVVSALSLILSWA